MKKRPIIIDTDPGIDDALAIAIALHSHDLDVRHITTVHGNVSLDKTTTNALELLAFFEKDIPVSAGADRPLIRQPIHASQIHGESGMDGYTFPEPTDDLITDQHAVNAMYQEIMESHDKITLVPIGPLTNIALLIRLYPEVVQRIEEIVLMGGAIGVGNASPAAEFNVLADPEAAHIVFTSGIPLAMLGLDIGDQARVFKADSLRLKEMNNTGEMVYHLFENYRGGTMETGLTMYDSTAIGFLLQPQMYHMLDAYVAVETSGTLTAGRTVVDLNGQLGKISNAKVAVGLDANLFKSWLMDSVKNCP